MSPTPTAQSFVNSLASASKSGAKFLPKPRRTGSISQKGCFGSSKKAKAYFAGQARLAEVHKAERELREEQESGRITEMMKNMAVAMQELPAPKAIEAALPETDEEIDAFIEEVESGKVELPPTPEYLSPKNIAAACAAGVTPKQLEIRAQINDDVAGQVVALLRGNPGVSAEPYRDGMGRPYTISGDGSPLCSTFSGKDRNEAVAAIVCALSPGDVVYIPGNPITLTDGGVAIHVRIEPNPNQTPQP